MKIYDIASAINEIDCNDWVKLQDVESIIAKVREDERANVTAEFMSNHFDRWEYQAGQADMLRRCEEAAYTDLLSLEDDIYEAFGKGSDAARIVAGYRSAMPSFQHFHKKKP